MKKLQRILSLVLACIMMLALVGCAGGNTPDESDAPTKQPIKAYCDFGGATVTIVDQFDDMVHTVDENGEAVTGDDAWAERLAAVETAYNVNIEVLPAKGNYGATMIASIISGKPAGHVLTTRANSVVNWNAAGVFADLTAAMQKTGINFMDSEVYNTVVTKYANIDGKQLCFGKRYYHSLEGIWMFNKRIFAEMNLENPYELYAKGEWTWDKVEEIATKATIRQSDGTVTQWGMASYMAMPMIVDMVLQNGGKIVSFDENGKPKVTLTDPKTVEAIERFSSWYTTKKILRTNYGDEVWDTVYKEFPNGNIAMFVGCPISYAVEGNMKDEYGIVGAPKASADAEYVNPVADYRCFFIPKTYEAEADKYIALMDALWQPYDDVSMEDLVTEAFAENLHDKESLNTLINLNKNPLAKPFDAWQMVNLEWVSPGMMDLVTEIKNGKSVGSVTDAYQTMFQEIVDEEWGEGVLTGK